MLDLLVLGGEENQGPLAGAASYAVGDLAAEVHNAFAIVLGAMARAELYMQAMPAWAKE